MTMTRKLRWEEGVLRNESAKGLWQGVNIENGLGWRLDCIWEIPG
jgi:hypothetical protein